MNTRWQRLQILAAVFLLLLAVFAAWYLMFELPGRRAAPEGTFICLPGRLDRL